MLEGAVESYDCRFAHFPLPIHFLTLVHLLFTDEDSTWRTEALVDLTVYANNASLLGQAT